MGDRTGSITIAGPDTFWPYRDVGYSRPVVIDGTLYFSLYIGHGYLYALDASTGETKWKLKREKGLFSPPLVVGDTLYFGTHDGLFFAVDLKTRREKWRHARGDQSAVRLSAAVAEGVLYYGANNGQLYALEAETGKVQWTVPSQGNGWSAPVVVDASVYVTDQAYLYRFDSRTGTERWKLPLPYGARAPLVANGLVYFRDFRGYIRTVDAESGHLQSDNRKEHQSRDPIAIGGSTIYFTGWDSGTIFAADAASRKIKWKFTLTYNLNCSGPVAHGDDLFFTCSDGRLYALDAITGKRRWRTDGRKVPLSAPTVAGGMIYFISDDGKVYALK